MGKRLIAAAVLTLLVLGSTVYFSAQKIQPPGPPPDLTGRWIQVGVNEKSDWYFYADITGDLLEIWWYLPAYGERALYWSGTFTPPTDGSTPYSWVSINDEAKAHTSQRASREPEKTYTYKDGRISFVLTAGHLQMGYALERPAASQGKLLPPQDLSGLWIQGSASEQSNEFYYAEIAAGRVEVWWCQPRTGSRALFWSGTFIAPENGATPFSWDSVNDLEKAKTSQRASREEEKTFTYQDGRISYMLVAGQPNLTYTLSRPTSEQIELIASFEDS